MRRILTGIVLVPLVLLAVLRAPFWMLTAIVGMVALLCIHEYLGIVEAYGIRPLRNATLLLTFFLFLPYALLPGLGAATIPVLVMPAIAIALLTTAMSRPDMRETLTAVSASLLAFPYIAFGLFCAVFPVYWLQPHGRLLVVFLFLVVWSGDIFAYYVGKNLGRRKMSPNISPNKTWEGAIASVVGSTALGVLFLTHLRPVNDFFERIHFLKSASFLGLSWHPVFQPTPIWKIVIASVVINIAAQLGDLAESMLKRGAGVKDSGSLLPGHGGMLDRVDALLFAAPVAVLIFTISRINP